MASGGAEANDAAEVVAAQFLTAPPGWTKLVAPKKTGFATRNEVVFVAPTGEQIRSRRQLVRYLKLHPGGPSIKEFNWLTEELRRSTRFNVLSTSISKATETPPRKRKNTSSSKKRTKGKKDDTDGEVEGEEKEDDADGEETKASEEVEMIDAGDKSKGDVSTEELVTAGDAEKDSGPKTEEKMDEMNIENLENQEATANETTSNPKDVVNNSLTTPALEEREEEAEKQAVETEARSKQASEEVEMIDAGDAGHKSKGDVSTEELVTAGDAERDSVPKTEEKIDEMNIEKLENQEATVNETTSNPKDEEVVNNSLTTPALEERKEEAEKQAVETKAPSKLENKEESEKQPAEPEAPSKLENNEADYKLTSDAKEEQVGSDSVLKPGLDENKELPDKQARKPEVLLTASSENKVENVAGTAPDGDGKVEKESEEAKVEKDCPAEEASTEKLNRPEESKANNDSLEENQDGTKPIDNHSLSCEETSRAQGNST